MTAAPISTLAVPVRTFSKVLAPMTTTPWLPPPPRRYTGVVSVEPLKTGAVLRVSGRPGVRVWLK